MVSVWLSLSLLRFFLDCQVIRFEDGTFGLESRRLNEDLWLSEMSSAPVLFAIVVASSPVLLSSWLFLLASSDASSAATAR